MKYDKNPKDISELKWALMPLNDNIHRRDPNEHGAEIVGPFNSKKEAEDWLLERNFTEVWFWDYLSLWKDDDVYERNRLPIPECLSCPRGMARRYEIRMLVVDQTRSI